ncbi:5'-nucleotidase/2',3'-cyclic phosphodiesterase-like esterase [Brachyspira suanatina]|uniref:5'-nucleotidase/2',3'-cyclic phosphodiesterase-like esterase n=1 Tax=Brachyspira suanatina TaxID=381802 RepID=A0A0G4K4Z5_9SPIR|nr:bifunctional UDP-sugar hydrolase/5'-nucleotidase [Brachyspira suanatina]CRF32246.1 5'-nucleotidase/2',3'-cyclic phosphodiesterase-like esterase [Brachyspira suanatina]
MKKIYFILIFILITISSCQRNNILSPKESGNIIIIHMNDTHGKDEEENGMYGAARRAAYIKQVKATNDNVLVLHAGDTITGSIYSTVFKGQDEVKIMNELGVGSTTVGNHFVDYGLDNFNQIIKDRKFPTLSVNIKNKSDNSYYAKPYMVTNINRVKVAIIGVTVTDSGYNPQYTQNLIFEDEIQSLKKFMSEIPLNTTNDVTILLSHAGYNVDREIANAMPNTFDIIIGGHTHTVLYNADIVNGTPIVQAGSYGQYLGNINLYANNGSMLKFNYKLVPMDSSIKQDPDMLALVNEMKAQVQQESNVRIGTLSEDLTYNVIEIRSKSTPLGNFVCDLIYDSNQEGDKADIVFINSGGIRAGFSKGDITLANIMTVSSFDNEVILVTLTGKDILDLLKIACKKSTVIQGNSGGSFLQMSKGMEVRYSSNGDLISAKLNNVDINESQSYRVALSAFIYSSSDYVNITQKGKNINMTGKDCRDDMISKIKSLNNIPSSYIDKTVRINVQ